MIAKNPSNRNAIIEYLNNISEDDFIDDIIIPIFSQNGYMLYRRNVHGGGEHGKDLIFYRHIKLFYDNEYIAVQAKAEKVTTSNVNKFADQVKRALQVPFVGKRHGQVYPNYVLFMNARTHTNDAESEFLHLVNSNVNVKILSQDNIVELIMDADFIPTGLSGKLEKYETVSDQYSEFIQETILSGDYIRITRLLDDNLKIDTRPLNNSVKGLIINYILKKWTDDPSWKGTVKPMQWLKDFFDFIQPDQYPKLLKVVEEYSSSHASREAKADTAIVMNKISPDQLRTFQREFIEIIIRNIRNRTMDEYPLLRVKWEEFSKSGVVFSEYKEVQTLIDRIFNIMRQIEKTLSEEEKITLKTEYRMIDSKLYYFLYPQELHIDLKKNTE